MDLVNKLNSLRDKINNVSVLDEDLKNTLGIEMYDFIYSDAGLKESFEKHLFYLVTLAQNDSFIKLQENIVETVIQILSLTNPKEVAVLQKNFNQEIISKLKAHENGFNNVTLTKLYKIMLDKRSYYKLGESYSPSKEEPFILTATMPALRQFETVQFFIGKLGSNIFGQNHKLHAKFTKLSLKYGGLWKEINEQVYNRPMILHTKEFEDYFMTCARIRPITGYECFYEARKLAWGILFVNLKKSCLKVINDLVEEAKIIQRANEPVLKKVFISDDRGIYSDNDKYEISGKRLKLLKSLDGRAIKRGKELASWLYKGDPQLLSKEIGKINKLFRKSLKVKLDLIIDRKGRGYQLNYGVYDINFEKN